MISAIPMTSMITPSAIQQRTRMYFLDIRIRYVVATLVLGLILVETLFGKILLLLGLLWCTAAILFHRARPSDQEVEEAFDSDVAPFVERALQSLNVDAHAMLAEPLLLRGPIELNAPALRQPKARPRTGRDGIRRSPINRVVVLLPLEDRLGIYSCQRDSLNDQTSQVSVEEHHYKDIVSLTVERDVEAAGGRAAAAGQVVSLYFKDGRRLSIPVSSSRPAREAEEGGPPQTGLATTVRAMQALMQGKR